MPEKALNFLAEKNDEEMIPPARPEALPAEPENAEDPVEKFLRETKSGSKDEAPERARGGGQSGMTDEARDIGA